jgi:hypothetical protein
MLVTYVKAGLQRTRFRHRLKLGRGTTEDLLETCIGVELNLKVLGRSVEHYEFLHASQACPVLWTRKSFGSVAV